MNERLEFINAKHWYQYLASNLERAGVKTRLFTQYLNEQDEEKAFVSAVNDERNGIPLP